jgi:predicted trehalose synthase
MCLFISIVVPRSLPMEAVKAAAEAHGLGFSPYHNAKLEAQLANGDRLVLTTTGHCDCGSALGSLANDDGPSGLAAEVRRLQARGWSESKIQRALAQRRASLAHKAALPDGSTRDPTLERWLGFLRQVLSSHRKASLAVLLHQYRGDLASERVALTARERVRAQQLDAAFLMRLHGDVRYEFTR